MKQNLIIFTLAASLMSGLTSGLFIQTASAQLSASPAVCEAEAGSPGKTGMFTKKRYSIKGQWTLEHDCEQTRLYFSEDFKTKGGPDLKVFLSPRPPAKLTRKTVTDDAVILSVLRSNKGAQSYVIPDNIDLSQYKSVVIHCQAFSVLWGGFEL